MHQDPAPNLQSPERILTEFFPGTPDNMKIALLMRTVNTDKYRSILDSMKIPGMVIPTYLELKRQSRTTMRQIAPSTSRDERRKAQGAGGKSHTKAEDLASCRFGNCCRRRGAKTLTKNATALATNEGLPQLKRPHCGNNRGQITIEHTTRPAPTHALEEDADAEAVVQREAADEDTAADTPIWTDRHQGRTSGATSRSKHSWEISGELYEAQHRAQFARRITSANRPQAVITCTTISRNLLSLVRLAANGGTSRSATRALRQQRKHVPHQDRRQLLRVEVAPPLDFDMTIDTTFHQSPASIAAGAKFGEHKTSQTPPPRNSRTSVEAALKGKHTTSPNIVNQRTDRVGGALVHTDIKTDVPTPSYRGDKYFIHFTDDKTRHTVPYALRKKSDYANALRGGRRHERIIDTLDACHGHIIRAPHVPRKYWPIVLKTVAIIYNNMTHGATDKIPSIELFRSADDLSALRIIGASSTYAHGAYVYDPVTSEYTSADIAFSPSNSPRVPTTPSRASTTHRFRTAAPVEGGGGDGLDEVDKFIHDALNQAPPTEGGASPIEGGGEPDLGALGIHGHSEQMVNDRVYKRITRITGDHTYEAYNHCEAVFDANKTLGITLVIPDWESVTVDRWEYLFSIPAGEEVYRHPNGKSCGKTRWDVAVYRL
ncbi:hypothetical protein RI054_15g72150 [Pseudoscourfieldia marina]